MVLALFAFSKTTTPGPLVWLQVWVTAEVSVTLAARTMPWPEGIVAEPDSGRERVIRGLWVR